MKYILTPVLLLFSAFLAKAQPQFTKESCFQEGDSSKIGFVLVMESFDPFISQTGSNFTWDFSGTGFPGPWGTWTEPTISYSFQASAKSTHVPLQSTQINEYANVGMGRDHFYSYSPNGDTLYYNGYYAGGTSYVYQVPVPYFVFPMKFGDQFNVKRDILNAGGTVKTGTVIRTWTYDGYGTVKFPYGTQSNVFRIYSKQIDSLTVNGIFINATVTEELLWMRESDGIPVLRLQKQGASNMYAWYVSTSGISTMDELIEKDDITIYPNPCSEYLLVNSHASLSGMNMKITDFMGRTVKEEKNMSYSERIDIQHLSNGLYFLQIGSTAYPLHIVRD
jgi:hypothetical protein